MSQFFEVLIFSQYIWGNVHYVHEINLISQESLMKVFYLPSQTNYENSETWICRRKADENFTLEVGTNC